MEIYSQTTNTDYKYHKQKSLNCRKCGSPNIKKNGKNRYGRQQYYCKECQASYAQTTANADYTQCEHESFKCRKCESPNIKKNGKNRYGHQQYYCNDCRASGVLEPKVRYTEEQKNEILEAYSKLRNMRGIERSFGVCRHTLAKWIKKSPVSVAS